jgi:putative N6-adenine-specific DNA methylase
MSRSRPRAAPAHASPAAAEALLDCWAVTHPGVEAITAAELAALGLAPGATEPGGVAFRADRAGLMRANLHLRTASRVLVRVAEFHAAGFAELERRADKVPWGEWVAEGAGVRVRATSRKSKLYHQGAVAERVVQAVGRAVAGLHEVASATDEEIEGGHGGDAAQQLVVRVVRDMVTVSADSSGALLHRRGYRLATAKAPLRETLAAALLLASGWDGTAPLVDPFCGSGTIPIEGALLARRIAPGLHRTFAFERWPGHDPARWAAIRQEALARILPAAGVAIVGADRDPGAVEAALANAERAGVSADVELRRAPLGALRPPEAAGWLVSNPPYGIRVGERTRLRDLYAQLGHVARARLPGWRVAYLSAHPEFDRQTGLHPESLLLTNVGGIHVRFVRATVPASED